MQDARIRTLLKKLLFAADNLINYHNRFPLFPSGYFSAGEAKYFGKGCVDEALAILVLVFP